ncbi:IS4 family transposase [Psychromonas ossibalaenae]|uniref:IS4 family transposase n=1 Tax=Psychromonas ossibalaenae TaxID=444922 RepID=UPI000364A63B|nr:IS4 family transposase [Psychromonas ossibalaenae]
MSDLNAAEWAQLIFGDTDLGDPRRTKRLTKLAGSMAQNAGESVVKASGDPATIEAAYRFIRNDNIVPEVIAETGFNHTCEVARECTDVLAIQDTTGISFKHNSLCSELGDVSSANTGSKSAKGRSLYVHSTLMLDAENEQIIGLANQKYWFRKEKVAGSKPERQSRLFKDKESYRWKESFDAVKQKTGQVTNIIDVCDREADVYEYLAYHKMNGHRFVVRAKENRKLLDPLTNLNELLKTTESKCSYSVDVKQKGGRSARQAKMKLSYQTINIKKPQRAVGEPALPINLIICQEYNKEESEPLCWLLYTSEPLYTSEDALKVVRYYELRWRIEEFHKVWKTDGTDVEGLRLQSLNNLKRIAVIQAFIAVRLMQLQELAQNKETAKTISCTVHVQDKTWKILWLKIEKNKAVPKKTPSLHWFYYAIAKLGGWYDSKRNGRVGVKAMWQGWLKLAEMMESIAMLESLDDL